VLSELFSFSVFYLSLILRYNRAGLKEEYEREEEGSHEL